MNNYFEDFEKENKKKKATALPAWVWIIGIIGLVISIVWGYSMGSTAAIMMDIGSIEDTTPDTSLGVLDFNGCLMVFRSSDGYMGYNLIDYPTSAIYYESSRSANSYGNYKNTFKGSMKFSANFSNMSYYDVSCVLESGIESENVKVDVAFEPNLVSGNMQARLYAVKKNYTTEYNADGFSLIKSEYITELHRFDGDSTSVQSLTYSNDVYFVFVVGAESAAGSYNLGISVAEAD